MAAKKEYRFKAKIEKGDGGGAFIFFPYNVEKEFGTKGKIQVKVTFDGVLYKGSMYKYGFPQHVMGVLKEIRKKIGKEPGDYVDVVLKEL